jgi:hypothetical protein
MLVQHFLAEAAANLVLGDRARAMQCPEAEVQRINHAPAEAAIWKAQRSLELQKWAAEQGLVIGESLKKV